MPSSDGKKGSIIMMKKNCGEFEVVVFCAGTTFDDFGRPAPYWTGVIEYRWDSSKQAYHVNTVQMFGKGMVAVSREHETDVASRDEVKYFINYLRFLENHYKRIYGE